MHGQHDIPCEIRQRLPLSPEPRTMSIDRDCRGPGRKSRFPRNFASERNAFRNASEESVLRKRIKRAVERSFCPGCDERQRAIHQGSTGTESVFGRDNNVKLLNLEKVYTKVWIPRGQR